jgi:hypothetical protein
MSMRLQIIQKTPTPIPTPLPAVLLVSLSIRMGANDVPRQPNFVEVFLERSTISLANLRYATKYLRARDIFGEISDVPPGG